jgi:hypothetical protein
MKAHWSPGAEYTRLFGRLSTAFAADVSDVGTETTPFGLQRSVGFSMEDPPSAVQEKIFLASPATDG